MEHLTMGEKSFLLNFLSKFISNKEDELWELAGKINYQERGKLLALCYASQKDKYEIINLMEVTQDLMTLHGVKYD